jgi:hypothetical protein
MSSPPRLARVPLGPALVCGLALLAHVPTATATTAAAGGASLTQTGQVEGTTPKASATATLQQCLTASTQTERSATFAGEMTATPDTAKMQMRIDVLERVPGGLVYHMVTAPGLGVWSSSAPGVKTYKNLNEVVNLAAPAFYRAEVRFRWLNARGRILKSAELRTRRCEQPAPATPETETPTPGSAPSTTTG